MYTSRWSRSDQSRDYYLHHLRRSKRFGSTSRFSFPGPAPPQGSPVAAADANMVYGLAAVVQARARIDKKRDALKRRLAALNARARVWSERERALHRKAARAALKRVEAAPDPSVARRGRRPRWPGLCHACMKRSLGEAGGPRHHAALCAKTRAHIAAGRRGGGA